MLLNGTHCAQDTPAPAPTGNCLAPNVSGLEVEKYGFGKALGGQFSLLDWNAEFPSGGMGSLEIKSLIGIFQGMWHEAQFLGFLLIFGTGMPLQKSSSSHVFKHPHFSVGVVRPLK